MAFEIRKNKSKFQIMGTGNGWELAPKKSDAIICCLNDFVYIDKYGVIPDILFIMDVLDEKPLVVSGGTDLGDIIQRINKLRIPFIAPFKYAEIPLSQPFPIEECFKQFGQPYFSNTIGYMIAYVLMEGAKEIDIYGINQASSSEYFYEKSGVEYWLGIAIGRGVKVTLHGDKSELLTNKRRFGGGLLYGYNQTFREILALKEKFGTPIIHKLTNQSRPVSRTIRTINS
jgi:hypothetical protein